MLTYAFCYPPLCSAPWIAQVEEVYEAANEAPMVRARMCNACDRARKCIGDTQARAMHACFWPLLALQVARQAYDQFAYGLFHTLFQVKLRYAWRWGQIFAGADLEEGTRSRW